MENIICKCCGEITIQNVNLDNLCLNCYQNQCDDYKKADVESEYDYYNGYGIA